MYINNHNPTLYRLFYLIGFVYINKHVGHPIFPLFYFGYEMLKIVSIFFVNITVLFQCVYNGADVLGSLCVVYSRQLYEKSRRSIVFHGNLPCIVLRS